jgi:phosphoribosylformimino-5-aminoimidazole carboxamide ribotide isomerase
VPSRAHHRRVLIIPAIDIMGGRCVRLMQGDFERMTTYSEDPSGIAVDFARAGAPRLHVVDLDAARGSGDNQAVIEDIIEMSGISVQVAGGIRTADHVKRWLAAGASDVVMATVAVREPELLAECAHGHPGQVMVALDVRDGKPAVSGWVQIETIGIEALVARWNDLPLAALILTSTDRDGTMAGPDLETLARVRSLCKLPIQYSGGISSLEDVKRVHGADVGAVILGRSLYEGKLSLEQALALEL